VDVRVSALIRSPASFASTILLPITYDTWDSATLKAVLIHEQTHVRNCDCYRLWLAALYRAIFWFNPLAHWLHWRLHVLSELTSDEAASTALGDRAAYAAILKSMSSPPELVQSMVAMAEASSLDRRLRWLSNEKHGHLPLARHWKALLTGAVLVVVGLAAIPWATAMVPAASHRPAALEFYLVDELNDPVVAQLNGTLPSGDRLYTERDGHPLLVKRAVVATGDEITQVTVSNTTRIGPTVNVRLNASGAASMLSVTHENVGHRLAAIYNGRVINDATVRGAFGASFQVSGLTTAEARTLAMKFDGASR
jgi:hypothetical protein